MRPNVNNAMKQAVSAAQKKSYHDRKKSDDFAEGNIKSCSLTVDYRIPAPSERDIAMSAFSKPEMNEYGLSQGLQNKLNSIRSQQTYINLPNPSLYSYRSLTIDELAKVHETMHISNFREPANE